MFKILPKHVSFYNKNGFLVCRKLFNKSESAMLKLYTNEVKNFIPKKGKHMIYLDHVKNSENLILTRTENFMPYHKKFRNLFKKKKILDLVSKLFGSKAVLFKDKINWKQPGGKGFEPHQDSQVWEGMYKAKTFMSVLISVDEANKKNGCLEIVANKHKIGLLGNNKSAIPTKVCRKLKWKKIITKPGDAIFFDSYTPHRSKKNNTKKSRNIIYLTYNLLSDGDFRKKYFRDKRISFPPNNERKKGKNYKYLI